MHDTHGFAGIHQGGGTALAEIELAAKWHWCTIAATCEV